MPQALMLIMIALVGACIGSFLNVLILRLPRDEEFVKTPSHCMTCGHRLRWYELIPIVSWLVQGGRCRACHAKISRQYPIVEAANCLVWLGTAVLLRDDVLHAALYCALFSDLLVLSVIDWRTFEIYNGLTVFVLALGVIQLAADFANWRDYVIGFFAVSVFLFILWLITNGAGIGMGDVTLMAAGGLLLGWKRILLALIIGSVAGSVIHIIRVRHGADRKLAFGPYLSAGIWLSALFGNGIVAVYLGLFGI